MGDQWLHEMAQRVIDNTGEWLTPTWIIAADLLRSCGGDPDDTASELVGLLIDEIERLKSDLDSETHWAAQYHADLQWARAEIERLTQQLNRVQADVELWAVTGRHRTCMCPACEDLRDIAEAAGGE